MVACSFCLVLLITATPVPAEGRPATAEAIAARLHQPINLEKGIDPNTPLKDALEFMSHEFGLSILIDTASFEEQGLKEVENQPVRLQRMRAFGSGNILQLLLSQLAATGTYLVRKEYVEIVSLNRAHKEATLEFGHPDRPVHPPLTVSFDKVPLAAALRDVADRSGISIVVDVRHEEKWQTAVSARFQNVNVHNAVRILANMANLKVAVLENVLFVSSRETAAELDKEKEKAGQPEMPRINGGGVPPPGM